jgi:hypothetical protein
VVRGAGLLLACILLAACSGSGGTATPGATVGPGGAASTGAPSPSGASGANGGAGAADAPITAKGPVGWDRGPYDLGGGNYRLDWTSDGTCSALYFGIVGVSNGYVESPPTAGDIALKDMMKGSRVIENVPAGSYFFNVSGVACKSYSATLTHE